jgi:hypothetical protein
MTPMLVRCPKCRAFLHLLVQLLPARATCTHCRTGFTLAAKQAITAPPEPPPAPVAPPTAQTPNPLSRLLRVLAVLVLLAVLVGSALVIVNTCFNDEPPVSGVTPSPVPASPLTHHPISDAKRFRGN